LVLIVGCPFFLDTQEQDVNLKPILGIVATVAVAMTLQSAPATALVNHTVFVEETGWHS